MRKKGKSAVPRTFRQGSLFDLLPGKGILWKERDTMHPAKEIHMVKRHLRLLVVTVACIAAARLSAPRRPALAGIVIKGDGQRPISLLYNVDEPSQAFPSVDRLQIIGVQKPSLEGEDGAALRRDG